MCAGLNSFLISIYAAVMKQVIISLVAVIGLTLTAVTGCTSSEDSASTVVIEAKDSTTEKSEGSSFDTDCVLVLGEFERSVQYQQSNGIEPGSQESFDEALNTFGRIWPQMNDPDLKSIFRELANGSETDTFNNDPNYVAFQTICGPVLQ